MSEIVVKNTGTVPQGSALSLFLFTLYTSAVQTYPQKISMAESFHSIQAGTCLITLISHLKTNASENK